MKPQFNQLLSDRASDMKASEIRELLKLTNKPDIISFAGGLPNPEAFPYDIIEQITSKVVRENGRNALQYGSTEGVTELRNAIADRMRGKGIEGITGDNILITHGSQQGLMLLSNVLIDPGDLVVVGEPTYLGGKNAFLKNKAKMQTVTVGDNGMDLDALEDTLLHAHKHGIKIKFIYVIPTFHNPAGVSMPLENRKRLIEIAQERDVIIVEDDPYSELRYRGEDIPPIMSLDRDGRVIYLGTFSKILSPGFRIAWMAGHPDIINKFVLAKQSEDLCTNTFGQYVAYEYMAGGHLDRHVENIKRLYSRKMEIMLKALDDHFPESVQWTKPDGGMFIWATLPGKLNATEMFPKALHSKVAYVTGSAFYPNGGGTNHMRLNFSYSKDEIIEEGIKRLAMVIEEEIARTKDLPDNVPPLSSP